MKLTVLLASLLCLGACDEGSGGGNGESDADSDADSDTDSDADSDTDTEPDELFVEFHEPDDGAVVRINQKIHIVFSEAGAEGDHVDIETVTVLLDDEEIRIWPYYTEESGNREFRFVPFPVWTPGEHHTVTILAGAALAGDPDTATDDDLTFEFTVDDTPFDQDYDPESTQPPTDAELSLMEAAGLDEFEDEDVVGDWDDPDSSLREVSIPVRPDDPDVAAFGQKMVDSLGPLWAVGLAAPQVGVQRRMFAASVNGEQRAFINPKLVDWTEDELYTGSAEGCLSIDGESAIVSRPAWISVEFDTPEGDHVTEYELENFDAKVFLHEYDHLNGILMTDREERNTP